MYTSVQGYISYCIVSNAGAGGEVFTATPGLDMGRTCVVCVYLTRARSRQGKAKQNRGVLQDISISISISCTFRAIQTAISTPPAPTRDTASTRHDTVGSPSAPPPPRRRRHDERRTASCMVYGRDLVGAGRTGDAIREPPHRPVHGISQKSGTRSLGDKRQKTGLGLVWPLVA